jgi:hypothetical protein
MSSLTGALDPKVSNLGQLIGLIQQNGQINSGWFSNALAELEHIPRHIPELLQLIEDVFGPASKTRGLPGGGWYSIPNPTDGMSPTNFYLVAPPPTKTGGPVQSAQIGIGVMKQTGYQGLSFVAYGYVPVFHLSATDGPSFVVSTQASHVGVAASTTDGTTFTAPNGVTFKTLKLDVDLFFSSTQLPSMALVFGGLKGAPDGVPGEYKTLSELLNNISTVGDWIASVILRGTYWLNNYVGGSVFTIGEVLKNACVLIADKEGKYQLNLDYLKANVSNPKVLAENFLFNMLDTLADSTTPVISIPAGAADSGIYVVKEAADDGSGAYDYGARLMIQDLQIGGRNGAATGGDGGDGGGSAQPSPPTEVYVQIGKWIAGEQDSNSWLARSLKKTKDFTQPGVSVYLMRSSSTAGACTSTSPVVTFAPHVEFVSLGLDVRGGTGQSLFDIGGYTLDGAELRVYVKQSNSSVTFGAAASLDGLGLPLGPNFGSGTKGSNTNPVAQSLLASGSPAQTPDDAAAGGDKSAVNPTFSISAAYAQGGSFAFQLYDADGNPSDKVILPVQRALGPLQCQRLGLGWVQEDELLSLLLDGGVKLGGLEVDLFGLSVGIPVSAPGAFDKYQLGLDGLDISFKGGPVEISGGLLKEEVTVGGKELIEYNGEALIKASDWTIAALGSWATFEGHPSLFVFAFLNASIGGPAFFFVTGLSAGFGYNRALKLPAQDEVQNFPFVAGLSDPSKIGGADASPSEALAALGKWVEPARGVNWIAAGVQFTSFELIKSNALLVVEFGEHFEIALLGLSRIRLPQSGPVTYAYVELGLAVVLDPTAGEFAATAFITPNSYVIDPACHLTGGFAFHVWFGDNPHAGDFVLTVGGYHPLFNKPDHYPDEPRLGFNWQVSDQVSIKGGAYFALTPSCVMGGGDLDIQFHSGNLAAWFTAHADFLIQWHPFYFLASAGVTVGVSYRVQLLFVTTTIKVELGADLQLWGPPTGGRVHVHLWIVSFTVSFGPEFGGRSEHLDWKDFRQLLPQDDKPEQALLRRRQSAPHALRDAAAGEPDDGARPLADASPTLLGNICRITINDGLLPRQNRPGRWLVRADHFEFTVQTTFPLTALDLEGPTKTTLAPPPLDVPDANAPPCARKPDGYFVGVRGMGINCADSVLTLKLTDKGERSLDLNDGWRKELKLQAVPAALWGTPIPAGDTPRPAADTLRDRLVGLQKISPKFKAPAGPAAIPLKNLSYVTVNEGDEHHVPFPRTAETAGPRASATSLKAIADTVALGSAATNRADIFAALSALGYGSGRDGDMTALASAVNLSYPAPPMLGSPFGV